jgi:hypothetical protein
MRLIEHLAAADPRPWQAIDADMDERDRPYFRSLTMPGLEKGPILALWSRPIFAGENSGTDTVPSHTQLFQTGAAFTPEPQNRQAKKKTTFMTPFREACDGREGQGK